MSSKSTGAFLLGLLLVGAVVLHGSPELVDSLCDLGGFAWEDPVVGYFEKYLNDPEETALLENISTHLKGGNVVESAWNVLLWEDDHISYDRGREEPIILPPSRVIASGKGLCGDYALITSGLLLAMNYSPVYVLAITFNDSETGHLTSVIKVNGRYLVVDQHPPIMDLGAYYRHWAIYMPNTSYHIAYADVYRASTREGRVRVIKIGRLELEDFLEDDYNMSWSDVEKLSSDIVWGFGRRFPGLKLDPSLSYGGSGYSWVRTIRGKFPTYADYYLPETHEKFVEFMLDALVEEGKPLDIDSPRAYWAEVKREGVDLWLTLYLGG